MDVPTYSSVVNSSNTFTRHCKVEFYFAGLLTSDVDKTSYFLADTEFHYVQLLCIQNVDCWGVLFFCSILFAQLCRFNICFMLKENNGKIALSQMAFYSLSPFAKNKILISDHLNPVTQKSFLMILPPNMRSYSTLSKSPSILQGESNHLKSSSCQDSRTSPQNWQQEGRAEDGSSGLQFVRWGFITEKS